MIDKFRVVLGSIIIIGLVLLACAVALGKVEEKTSYGLTPLLIILGKIASDFSEWAFRTEDKDKKKDDIH